MKVRKITNIIACLIIGFCIFVIIYDKFSEQKEPVYLFYSLDEKRYINDEKDYRINIYSYNKIDLNYANFYYKSNNNLMKIDVLKLDMLGTTSYNNYLYNIYNLYVLNSDKFTYNEIVIEYDDTSYLLKINKNILNDNNDKLLDFNYLNGHFAYVNNNLLLMGISIEFNEDITINNIKFNENIYVINSLIVEKNEENNIIENLHDYTLENNSNFSFSKNKRYYLPLGYKKLELVIVNKIKFDEYRVNTLDFLNTPRELKDYNSFINKGSIYVRN